MNSYATEIKEGGKVSEVIIHPYCSNANKVYERASPRSGEMDLFLWVITGASKTMMQPLGARQQKLEVIFADCANLLWITRPPNVF